MVYKLLIFLFTAVISLNSMELSEVKTYQGDFSQVITKNDNTKIVYLGKIYIKQPSSILWQYQKPIIKNVYVNDYMVIVDEPALEQVIFSEIKENINFMEVIQKAKKVSGTYYKTTIDHRNYNLVIIDGILKKIEYMDDVENVVVITFSNIKINKDIDDATFKFQVPNNYDIVRK